MDLRTTLSRQDAFALAAGCSLPKEFAPAMGPFGASKVRLARGKKDA
jgi:hypothetical protein